MERLDKSVLTGDPLVDDELHQLLAIVYRQFISPWYARIQPGGPLPQDFQAIYGQIIGQIAQKLAVVDPMALVLHVIGACDQHLTDMHVALATKDPAAVYLAMHPHDAIGTREMLDQYLVCVCRQLVSMWVPEAPEIVSSLFVTILTTIFDAMVRALSEPWLIHELLVKQLDPQNVLVQAKQARKVAETVTRKRTKRKRATDAMVAPLEPDMHSQNVTAGTRGMLAKAVGLFAGHTAQNDPAILLFIYHQVLERHAVYNALYCLAWPCHGYLARKINLLVLNLGRQHLTSPKLAALVANLRNAVFPNGYLGPARVPPPPDRQRQLRRECGRLLNAKVDWIDIRCFDIPLINQRFLLGVLDHLFKLLS